MAKVLQPVQQYTDIDRVPLKEMHCLTPQNIWTVLHNLVRLSGCKGSYDVSKSNIPFTYLAHNSSDVFFLYVRHDLITMIFPPKLSNLTSCLPGTGQRQFVLKMPPVNHYQKWPTQWRKLQNPSNSNNFCWECSFCCLGLRKTLHKCFIF